MNKQEAIDKIKNIGTLKINDTIRHQQFDMVDKNKVLDIISQIDEPKKVVVPQFVAEWYEDNKDNFEMNIFELCVEFRNCRLDNPKLRDWFQNTRNKGIQTLVNMHQFSYEVEEKKKYRVILKRNSETPEYLVDTEIVGFVFYSNIYTYKWKHTRKELEDNGFGWVFDCEDVEVEEVEE